MQVLITINDAAVAGVTAARAAYNAALPATVQAGDSEAPNPALLATDADYITHVMAAAVESWNRQYAPAVVPDVPPVVVDGVPQVISKRQGRAQLKADGMLAAVEGYMDSLPADDDTRMAYDDASEWRRTDPNVVGMMTMLGKTDADADAFFVAAAKL